MLKQKTGLRTFHIVAIKRNGPREVVNSRRGYPWQAYCLAREDATRMNETPRCGETDPPYYVTVSDRDLDQFLAGAPRIRGF